MKRFACGAMALCLMPACLILACLAPSAPVRAQNQAVDDLKGKIFDARMAKQTFAGGLKFCNELDGKHFYFQARDRVLDLEEYHRSLENLAKQQVFNPRSAGRGPSRTPPNAGTRCKNKRPATRPIASWWRACRRSRSNSRAGKTPPAPEKKN